MSPAHDAVNLTAAHADAVARHRCVVENFDTLLVDPGQYDSMDDIVKYRFTFIDDPSTHIDSIWWKWCEGNVVPYPSKFLPLFNHSAYRKWIEEGVDIVRIFQEETHKRGLECFYSHRMNGSDSDPQYVEGRGSFIDDGGNLNDVPLKREHPDWLIELPWGGNGNWNFAVEGVRAYVLRNLREIAEDYDFDGLELDFARGCPVLPPGRAWEDRHLLTELVRSLRLMTLEVERRRGRPFLLAARVPENLMGCHFDGIDVETWASDQLVDIFTIGVRNFDVDVAAFRHITDGTGIKLYCVLDDHHSSDGYAAPPIEVFRGVFSNWYRQGADGFQTFNFKFAPDPGEECWELHLQAYRELGDPQNIKHLNKTFVAQRRGGGHGAPVVPFPEDWKTPRRNYINTNMLAPLPAGLDNAGAADTLLTLFVGDDIAAESEHVSEISLRMALSDPSTASLQDAQKLEPVRVREYVVPKRVGGPGPAPLYTSPPANGIEDRIEVRINNIGLGQGRVEGGWLAFDVRPEVMALGENLIGVCVTERPTGVTDPIQIEKLELDVSYRSS